MLWLSLLSLTLLLADGSKGPLCLPEGQTSQNCLLESDTKGLKTMEKKKLENILGGELQVCGMDPVTGFTRSGFCETGPQDYGVHTVCAVMTQEFLDFTKAQGNDLSTPNPQYGFKGLKPGDSWCLCASRWDQAYEAGKAPLVNLEATEISTLKTVKKERLIEKKLSKAKD